MKIPVITAVILGLKKKHIGHVAGGGEGRRENAECRISQNDVVEETDSAKGKGTESDKP